MKLKKPCVAVAAGVLKLFLFMKKEHLLTPSHKIYMPRLLLIVKLYTYVSTLLPPCSLKIKDRNTEHPLQNKTSVVWTYGRQG